METFSALLALCEGNSPFTSEFPSQRPLTRNSDVLFDPRLNKRLSKQPRRWWFETPSRSFWRHYNEVNHTRQTQRTSVNSLRLRQNGRHFADDIFKCIFLNKNVWIPIKISLKFVPKGPVNIIPALVQMMAWRRPGDKPLSEPIMVSLPTHICVALPQRVKSNALINTLLVTLYEISTHR